MTAFRCPACQTGAHAVGMLHAEWSGETCNFALLEPIVVGLANWDAPLTFAHCHACGNVMPDDYLYEKT